MSAPAPWPGRPYPLGASWDGEGTNFALAAAGATAVELCLFDDAGRESRCSLTESTFHVWHGYLPGVAPGQRYGYRVDGPFEPAAGLRFNRHKLLLDPYALAVDGELTDDPAVYGHPPGHDDRSPSAADSAPFVPRGVVVHDAFPWGDDHRPDHPWADTVIYETHVRGMTARHPDVPPRLRGSYAGLAHPAVLGHLRRLGVTAVELLPVHQFVSEPALQRRGLRNYWGYNTIGFFAPHAGYASSGTGGEQVREFKAMVRALHAADIEVILDVVYNHTAEGDQNGPTLSFRGIDNRGYYRLDPRDPRRYRDFTGCGNTLDLRQPVVLRLVMDSLRYWVEEMHVDGFRFDLAPALARGETEVDKLATFLQVVGQDPVVSRVKLIAEPWDVGDGGYQVGEFPPLWSEWNGRYRDCVRDFWRGRSDGLAELGFRLSGSADLFADDGRRPYASVNFVTAHDGFTLADLVSYSHKHNQANGEHNRDGEADNRSDNHGVEGPTDDPAVLAARRRTARNLLATLLLSAGVPMLLAGDEMGRSQGGNNNAYCQDNETAWLGWQPGPAERDLLDLAGRLVRLRRRHPVLRQPAFFRGQPTRHGGRKDLAWFAPRGAEMTPADWSDPAGRTLGMYLSGQAIRDRGPRGETHTDDSFLILLHGGETDTEFLLPAEPWATGYVRVLDTADPLGAGGGTVVGGSRLVLTARSVQLLRVVEERSSPRE